MTLNLHLKPYHLLKGLIFLTLLNVIAITGTWMFNATHLGKGYYTGFVLNQFDLSQENVAANWYSSMLMLLTGFAALVCYCIDSRRFRNGWQVVLNMGWLLIFMIFATLSMDEVGSFHETIGDTKIFEAFGRTNGWYVFYILIAAVGLFMVSFCWLRFKSNLPAFIFGALGVLLFASNPFQENFEISTMRASPDPQHWVRPVGYLLLEEGSELFASLCFLVALVLYITRAHKKKLFSQSTISIIVSRRTAGRFFAAFITILVTLLVLADVFHGTQDPYEGILKNWFPSALAFTAATLSLYLYFIVAHKRSGNPVMFLILFAIGLVSSMYYASNMYTTDISVQARLLQPLTRFGLTALIFFSGLILMKNYGGNKINIPVSLWMAFCFASFCISPYYIPEIGFAGFSSLMYVLFVVTTRESGKALPLSPASQEHRGVAVNRGAR